MKNTKLAVLGLLLSVAGGTLIVINFGVVAYLGILGYVLGTLIYWTCL